MAPSIDPQTRPGRIDLRVSDLETEVDFYERTVGLQVLEKTADRATLGAGGKPVVTVVADPDAPHRPPGTTGLFHLAILVPDRIELGRSLRRIAEQRWPLAGASDHLVSEALYLSDPEGNGIEIYRDRPKEEWQHRNGELQMATLPLDLDSVMSESDGGGSDRMAAETRMGHVHLNVSDLDQAEEFYVGTLGFDVTVRGYPGALFFSAGDYHHHIAVNTWRSEGGQPPPVGSRGLDRFTLLVPDHELDRLRSRLDESDAPLEQTADGLATADPSGNRLLIATR
jgi:catechol 2,3-dioxygenase